MIRLAAFIRANRQQILDEWVKAVSELPSAHGLNAPTIRDHIPELLDALVESIERNDVTAIPTRGLPRLHAALRLREGYDLRQVVAEYRTLRRVIHAMYSRSGDFDDDMQLKMKALRVMHAAMDSAIGDAVDQYAVDREKSREMFISMLGHDLRDPLNVIVFGAQTLVETYGEELPAHAVKAALRVRTSATRMERMIRDLLDFAHGRLGGGLPIVPAPIADVRSIVADTVHEFAHANPERQITFGVSDQGDFAVIWDRDRLAQAIANLVSNAIAHGQDPIVVELEDRGSELVVNIRNRGEIPAALLPTLFDPFTHFGGERRQGEGATPGQDRRRGHLGLGLYIVHEIATGHGGTIVATSAQGETTFRITLPRDARAGHDNS
jgi:signal transduction histidine kinase